MRKNLPAGRVASLAQWGERKLLKMLKWAVHVVYACQVCVCVLVYKQGRDALLKARCKSSDLHRLVIDRHLVNIVGIRQLRPNAPVKNAKVCQSGSNVVKA